MHGAIRNAIDDFTKVLITAAASRPAEGMPFNTRSREDSSDAKCILYCTIDNNSSNSIKVGVLSEFEGLLAKCGGAFTKNICPAEDPNHCSLGSSAALPKLENRKHGSPEWEWAWGFGPQICFTNADTTTPVCSLVHRRSPFFRFARSHLSRLQTFESYIDASTTCIVSSETTLN